MIDPFRWSEAFAVGDETLDEEHRAMVGLINQICIDGGPDRFSSKAISLLSELEFVSEAHFRNEERLLHRIEVEIDLHHLQTVVHIAIEDHARSHRRSLDALHRLMERARGASAGDGPRLCQELKSWFVDHAIGQEAQVKTILQSTRHLSEVD